MEVGRAKASIRIYYRSTDCLVIDFIRMEIRSLELHLRMFACSLRIKIRETR